MSEKTRFWIVSKAVLLLGFWIGLGMTTPVRSEEKPAPHALTSEDLNALRARIFSQTTGYNDRLQIASTLTRLFELQNRPRNARRLCLDFYDSLASILEDEPANGEMSAPYIEYAQAIDRGKRRDAASAMDASIANASGVAFPPCLSLLALKADNMPCTYQALYSDFANQKLTPYSLYVLGLLAAREKRFIEGERFMAKAKGALGSPLLERWLEIDLAKLSIVNSKVEEARKIIQEMLKKNPTDPQALNILIFSNLETKKDIALQQLSQLIPLLYPDPYLIAETAKLAIQLMELETAAKILEQYEPQVEPNRDFYEVFAFVRKNQGRQPEADQYIQKARQIHDSRVAVSNAAPLSDELKEAVDSRDQRRKEVESLGGLDTLSKAYYCLLDEDAENAILSLQAAKSTPYESLVLAAIQRRTGRLRDAAATLQQIKASYPLFRPYEVISLLAELSSQLGNAQDVNEFRRDLINHFPGSYQAEIASSILGASDAIKDASIIQPIRVSPRMSRYANYAAPFILTEIREHWGDSASFVAFTTLLNVTPRQGILFHEFVSVLASVTRHQVVPLVGTSGAITNCLTQDIPVVFCQGNMFNNQLIAELTLLVGADPSRGQFFAEGITPDEPHLFTESKLLEGICFAVFPSSLEPNWTPETKEAIERGKEYIKLHLEASHIHNNPDYDASFFIQRQQSILQETDPSFLPHKLAFLRWTIKNKPGNIAEQYLKSLESFCTNSADYWFLAAGFYSNQKKPDEANTALRKALNRRPEYPRYILAQVRILDQTKKSEEALHQAEMLRDQYPENALVSSQLLLLYKKQGNAAKEKDEEERLKKLLNVESIKIEPASEEEPVSELAP